MINIACALITMSLSFAQDCSDELLTLPNAQTINPTPKSMRLKLLCPVPAPSRRQAIDAKPMPAVAAMVVHTDGALPGSTVS